MSVNKNNYLDQLLSELKTLEESVHEIKNSQSMPFSFFRESFNKVQEVSRLLHNLEFLQLDEMKNQMEKLVYSLSESEKKGKEQQLELEKSRAKEIELKKDLQIEKKKEVYQEIEPDQKPDQKPDYEQVVNKEPIINKYAESFVLPEYRNPIMDAPSLEKAPDAYIDMKKNVSLNDRFLFQRELFNNNMQKMNNTIDELNSLESYEEAERYIRDNFSWDFDNTTVNDFMLVVRKGFK